MYAPKPSGQTRSGTSPDPESRPRSLWACRRRASGSWCQACAPSRLPPPVGAHPDNLAGQLRAKILLRGPGPAPAPPRAGPAPWPEPPPRPADPGCAFPGIPGPPRGQAGVPQAVGLPTSPAPGRRVGATCGLRLRPPGQLCLPPGPSSNIQATAWAPAAGQARAGSGER